MRLIDLSVRQPICCWAFCCLLMGVAWPGVAQESEVPQPQPQPAEPQAEAEDDAGPMTIAIDLDRLLFDTQSSFQDPVWQLAPESGRRIVLLPFTVDNVERANKLSRFPISIRTGRFIGFVIPKAQQAGGVSQRVELSQVVRAAPDALQRMLFEPQDDGQAEREDANDLQAPSDEKPVPDNAPRLSREMILHPDGTVQWEMDRSFHAGNLQAASAQNLYAYKIDPEQLRAAQPERPERLARTDGEDARAYAERKRQQQLDDRDKQQAYRELRDSLRSLPESFREKAPGVFYAAIELPDNTVLSMQGPAPLPWNLEEQKKQLFVQLAQGGQELAEEQGKDLATQLIGLAQDHPLDAQAIAIATTRSSLAGKVKPGDPGYELLSELLASKDLATRRIALYGVATVVPPTLASAQLIGVAGEAALGEERKMLSFASLGKLFSTQAGDPENARVLIDRVSAAIADPEGPASPRIIEQVLDSLGQSLNTGVGTLQDSAAAIMIASIDLSGVKEDEVQGVAKAVIEHAPKSPVAAGWLDQKLLGSEKAAVVDQTLALLEQVQIKAVEVGQVIEEVPASPVAEQVAEPDTDALVLTATIPMHRADHALLGLLDSDDAQRSAKAWSVLGRFHLALPEVQPAVGEEPAVAEGPAGEPAGDPMVMLFDAVLAKAAAREQTPPGVVDFIVSQQHPAIKMIAPNRLIALLANSDADEALAKAAVARYIASPDQYTQAITALKSIEKQRMLEVMYRTQESQAPLMAGLIADTGLAMGWFTAYLKEQGKLPDQQAWAELAKTMGQSALMQSAQSADTTIASAAAAAMVASVGGSAQQEQAFAQNVALMEARTPEQVKQAWDEYRNRIFAQVFKAAAGTYRLVATLTREDPAGADVDAQEPPVPPVDQADGGDAEPAKAAGRIDLGLVELRAEGTELSLSVESVALTPTPDRLGIRIVRADTLRTFNKPEITKLPAEQLSQPIDLLPQADGVWSGELRLPDGQVLGVRLEPAG